MSFHDVMELDFDVAVSLVKLIEPIRAQENLLNIKMLDFPTMKPETRKKFHNSLSRSANNLDFLKREKPLTMEDIARIINDSSSG